MRIYLIFVFIVSMSLFLTIRSAWAGHYDISPCFQDGKLVTGGLDHEGNHVAAPITVYGYDFGEDPYDPYNPTDPGVNQSEGTGNLPVGALIQYNICSSLLYWDGNGEVNFGLPVENTYLTLTMGTRVKTLTGTSGYQSGTLIQTVATGGVVHKHFVTSLFDAPGVSNSPRDTGYTPPTEGIYAFSLELTMTMDDTTYTSDPVWVVFNNGMEEEIHEAAMNYFVPEPASLLVLMYGGFVLQLKRKSF